MLPPLVVIVGPTGSGKTEFAIEIAEKYNGEIICADSRTVYRGMDIGTAKPNKQQRALVPHHLLDVVEPNNKFTAADFKALASSAIQDIASRKRLAVMVGGTGLYIDSIIFDYKFGEPADPYERSKLEDLTVGELQDICRNKNIEIPINYANKRHLIRAIELGGLTKQAKRLRPNTLVLGLSLDRAELYERIEQRAHTMISAGIIKEIRQISERYGWQSEAMKANIYAIFKDVLDGQKTEAAAIEQVIQTDKALIKRQLTWFKRNPYIVWGTRPKLKLAVNEFLRRSISP